MDYTGEGPLKIRDLFMISDTHTSTEHASEAPPPAYTPLGFSDTPSSSSLSSTEFPSPMDAYYQDRPLAVKQQFKDADTPFPPGSGYTKSNYSCESPFSAPAPVTPSYPPYPAPGPQPQFQHQYGSAANNIHNPGMCSRTQSRLNPCTRLMFANLPSHRIRVLVTVEL